MKLVTVPVIAKRYVTGNLTAIEVNVNGQVKTAFKTGDLTADTSILANIVINEPGDKFTALNDSKTLDDKGKPLYKKGDVITRTKESIEFKSFAGNNRATEFAQGAAAFGLNLIVQM